MCGITGFLAKRAEFDPDKARLFLKSMTDALAHRGPDAEGFWLDVDHGIAIGHRWLSIIDLSKFGAQPMMSP